MRLFAFFHPPKFNFDVIKSRFKSTSAIVPASAPPVSTAQRYRQFESEYPGHVVLMQVGDFYEIYGGAVDSSARILDIAVTKAPGKALPPSSNVESVAMTGFPVRSIDTFLAKLIKAGESVVIADQFALEGTPRFDRRITRIVTPGTVVEENLLDGNRNNFIMFINSIDPVTFVLAWMDVSTGHFAADTCRKDPAFSTLISTLSKLKPREILHNFPLTRDITKFLKHNSIISRQIDKNVAPNDETGLLETDEQFTFTTHELDTATQLLAHIKRSMLRSSPLLKPLQRFSPTVRFMSIDPESFRSLDILSSSSSSESKTSLFDILNECKTTLGSRLLVRRLQAPFLQINDISAALDRVEGFVNLSETRFNSIRKKLEEISDIERIHQRLCLRRSQGVSRDLRTLARSLQSAIEVIEITNYSSSNLHKVEDSDDSSLKSLLSRIVSAFNEKLPLRDSEGLLFCPNYDSELDSLRKLGENSAAVFTELEFQYRQRTGLPNLKIAPFKSDQHIIEIPKSLAKSLPLDFFRPVMQTETRARFTTEELLTKSLLLRTISDKILEKELSLLSTLVDSLLSHSHRIRTIADWIAQIDLDASFALLAQNYLYCRPIFGESEEFNIIDGRHPVLDKLFSSASINSLDSDNFDEFEPALQHFTPNSLQFTDESKFLLLTGPNMGGKSTFLRQNALIALMAQCGSFVPARECRLRPVDAIFTRIGASDDLSRDKSTFMVEMSETAHIIRTATPNSLLIIDEIGRGTSSTEGLALASAIALHLIQNVKARTLFATHYHELSSILTNHPIQFACTDAEILSDGGVVLIPKVRPGIAKHSFALPVAALAGLPKSIINHATSLLNKMV